MAEYSDERVVCGERIGDKEGLVLKRDSLYDREKIRSTNDILWLFEEELLCV